MAQSRRWDRAAPEQLAAINAEEVLVAPIFGMVALVTSPYRNVRIDHGAALRATANRRVRTAMIQIGAGIGYHFFSLNRYVDQRVKAPLTVWKLPAPEPAGRFPSKYWPRNACRKTPVF